MEGALQKPHTFNQIEADQPQVECSDSDDEVAAVAAAAPIQTACLRLPRRHLRFKIFHICLHKLFLPVAVEEISKVKRAEVHSR